MKKCKLCNLCGKTFQNYSLLKTRIEKVHDQKVVECAALNEINNLELGLQVFKCQNCGKMCPIKRHSKLHEVKNMDEISILINCLKKIKLFSTKQFN